MERPPRRQASKVANYRRYHLSGDLDKVVQGIVSDQVSRLEHNDNMAEPMIAEEENQNKELTEAVQAQRDRSARLQLQVENMKLRNEIEAQQLQQEEWEAALQQLKEAKEKRREEHAANLNKMRDMTKEAPPANQAVSWLQNELQGPGKDNRPQEPEVTQEEREKALLLAELRKQQEQLQKQINDLTGDTAARGVDHSDRAKTQNTGCYGTSQDDLLTKLKAALGPKETNSTDHNRLLLKALTNGQNRIPGISGTSTLNPDILDRLSSQREFSMAEWLASLNKQEEGEFDISKFLNRDDDHDCRQQDCKHSKIRSGMLDKSTTNIRRKEVWPQKNLGEDWAEEEIEFKQLKFEHLVAGETRTIETCAEPAQILGRLRLLRRMAYLKLRGMDWQLIRKMYAAILSSIETGEYSWESNFDRFESILYRKAMTERPMEKEHKPQEGRKRYCRDYNKAEGCPMNSPHLVSFGKGPTAIKRMVYHCCAPCLARDKVLREHPEGHPECPHRA